MIKNATFFLFCEIFNKYELCMENLYLVFMSYGLLVQICTTMENVERLIGKNGK